MPGLHKGVSTQHHNQQVLAKPRHHKETLRKRPAD